MPETSRLQKLYTKYKTVSKGNAAMNSGRIVKPKTKHNTPVTTPSNHMMGTEMRKLVQGVKATRKAAKTRFR